MSARRGMLLFISVRFGSSVFLLGVVVVVENTEIILEEEKKEEKYTTVISISPYYIHAIVITLYHKLVEEEVLCWERMCIEVLS